MTKATILVIPDVTYVGKRKYTVQHVPTVGRKSQCLMGQLDVNAKIIDIAKKSSYTGKRYSPKQQRNSYLHELIHAVLYEMKDDQWRHEAFVTRLANVLQDALERGK